MKARVTLVLAPVLVLLLAAAGCDRARSDAQIAQDVQQKIQSDANLPNKQITVNANNGVVTLSGNVGTEMERLTAANDASQVEGVRTVVNNLQLAQTAAAAAPVESAPAPSYSAPSRRSAARPSANRPAYEPPAPVTPPAGSTVGQASSGIGQTAAAPRTPEVVQPVTIPVGTPIAIRMIDAVESDKNQPGDRFRATLDSPIMVDDQVIIPRGADIEGRVVELATAGHFKGRSQLALELSRLMVNGKTYQLQTNQWSKQGGSRGKRTAATVGGGAALGAIIGGLAGGGKGAAIGAAVGAGAGTGVQAATKSEQVRVPSETVLDFALEAPVTVTPASSIQRQGLSRRNEAPAEPNETNDDEN
jgi:hypothetical protein